MSDKKNKEEFINFLMKKKHEIDSQEEPIGLNHIKNLRFNELDDIKLLYREECSKEEAIELFINLQTILSGIGNAEQDLLFAILNSNSLTVKLLKDKEEVNKFPSIVEWYKKAFDENKKYLKEFNTPAIKKTVVKKEDKNVKKVVTRFPPEPSGFLHIGHAKAALVNFSLAEKGNGRLILRFDDTNPDKKYEEFEDQIIKDLKELKICDYEISHSSDYFSTIIDKAKFLIKERKAYCDNTDQETMRAQRMDGIESKNRNTEVETNLEIFDRMLRGDAEGYCLRAKIDMKDNNKAMRDPVIFRSTKAKHYRVGDELHAFPTYDFTCPILDSVEGVTLACRSNEYRDRNKQYYWFIENLGLVNKPEIFDFSRLNFENTVLSKRKINELIRLGCVSGWDDPRLATIQGIKRAGMDMVALREYILLQGASHKTSTISWDKVWAMNKKAIDPKSPRFMCVPMLDAVTVTVEGIGKPFPYYESIPLHKKNPDLGKKEVLFDSTLFIAQEDAQAIEENEEFTLMNWGNAILTKKVCESNTVKNLSIKLNLKGDYKKTKNKISWISKMGSVIIKTYEYSNLLKDNDAEDLYEAFNHESISEEFYYAESSLVHHNKEGEHVQFERIGFFYCDKPYIYNLVPFTKQKRNK